MLMFYLNLSPEGNISPFAAVADDGADDDDNGGERAGHSQLIQFVYCNRY